MASRRAKTAGGKRSAAWRWLAIHSSWALAALAFQSTTVAAQTSPFPRLPPEPPPTTATDPASAGPTQGTPGASAPVEADDAPAIRPRPWEYALGAGVGWNSNVNFDYQSTVAGDSAALSPVGSLTRVFWGRQGELRAGVAGSYVWYPSQEIQRHYVNAELAGRYRSSPRTIWSLEGNLELGNSDASRLLIDQGLLLPQVETRTVTSQLSVEQKIGGRSALHVTGRFYNLDFIDANQYQPGRSIRGTIGVDRRLSSGDTGSLQYSVEDVLADSAGRSYLTHYASLIWSHLISQRSGILFEGGASYTPDAELASLESEATFFGGVSFSRRVKQSDVRLYLRREVVPAFGFGVSRAETRGELSAAVPMGKDWRLSLVANHVQPSAPAGVESFGTANTDQVNLSLGRRMKGKLELSANVRYRRRGPTDATTPTQEFVAGLFLTLLTPSARLLGYGF